MEVCNICHQEIKPNQKYKYYVLTGKVHLACYNKAFRNQLTYGLLGGFFFLIGLILFILSFAQVNEPIETELFTTGQDIALLIFGIIGLVIAALSFIWGWVKYFSIRKNPPTDD